MIQEKSMLLLQISTVGSFQLRGGWEMEVSNGFGSLSEKRCFEHYCFLCLENYGKLVVSWKLLLFVFLSPWLIPSVSTGQTTGYQSND